MSCFCSLLYERCWQRLLLYCIRISRIIRIRRECRSVAWWDICCLQPQSQCRHIFRRALCRLPLLSFLHLWCRCRWQVQFLWEVSLLPSQGWWCPKRLLLLPRRGLMSTRSANGLIFMIVIVFSYLLYEWLFCVMVLYRTKIMIFFCLYIINVILFSVISRYSINRKLVNKIKLYHPPDKTFLDRTRPNGATST